MRPIKLIPKIAAGTSGLLWPALARAQGVPGGPSLSDKMKDTIGKLKLDLRGGKATDSPEAIIGSILYTLFSFLTVIFMILIIVGGYTWMTAGGNEDKVRRAKGLIWSASIGILIVFTSYVITVLVITVIRSA